MFHVKHFSTINNLKNNSTNPISTFKLIKPLKLSHQSNKKENVSRETFSIIYFEVLLL